MSCKLFLCFALMVSAQVCLAVPTTTVAPFAFPSMEEIVTNANKAVSDTAAHIQHMLGLPDTKNFGQVTESFKNSSSALSKQLNDIVTSLKAEVDPNAEATMAAFQNFFTKVNKTIGESTKKISEYQVSELGPVWSKQMSYIVEEGSKLRATIEKEAPHAQESLIKALKNIMDTTSKATNSFATEVHELVGHDKHPDHKNHHKA